MSQLLRRKHAVERPDGTREVTKTRAEKLEQPTPEATARVVSADIKLVVGPPGCCCTSELPVRKKPRRA
jgi:hypothetical protein